MNSQELKEAVAGTLFGRILDIMESGDFVEIEEESLDGYEITGFVANVFERACVSIIAELQEAINNDSPRLSYLPNASEEIYQEALDQAISIAHIFVRQSFDLRIPSENLAMVADYKIVRKRMN